MENEIENLEIKVAEIMREKNMFLTQASKFWRWVVASSANPQEVSLMVKGMTSLAVVQAIFSALPLLGVHVKFDAATLGDSLYTVTYSALQLVSAIVAIIGAVRKLKITLFGSKLG